MSGDFQVYNPGPDPVAAPRVAEKLDYVALVKLWNTCAWVGVRDVIALILRGASLRARLRERTRVLELVAALMPGDPRTLARRIFERSQMLARKLDLQPIDIATADGAIRALLILNSGQPFSRPTLVRALERPRRRRGRRAFADAGRAIGRDHLRPT